MRWSESHLKLIRYARNGALITVSYYVLTQLLLIYFDSKILVAQIAYLPITISAFFIHKYSSFQSTNEVLPESLKYLASQLLSFFLLSYLIGPRSYMIEVSEDLDCPKIGRFVRRLPCLVLSVLQAVASDNFGTP